MINLRYHIVSLAAVFLALAVGIVLGAGWLGQASQNLDTTSGADSATVGDFSTFDAAYATKSGPKLISGALANQSVVIFTLPGAKQSQVDAIAQDIKTAGGTVTGQVGLTSKLLTTTNRQFADGIASQSAGDAANGSTSYQRIGQAMSRAYINRGGGAADQTAQTIRSAFVAGGLVSQATAPTNYATMALFVTGPAADDSDDAGTVIASISPAIDEAGNGVVVAGPVSSGTAKGVVGTVRESDAAARISTFDVTDLGTGQVATVLVLSKEAAGDSGSWGVNGAADGPMP